jgi:hypothetical protein
MGVKYFQTDDRDDYFASLGKRNSKPPEDKRKWTFTDKDNKQEVLNKRQVLTKFLWSGETERTLQKAFEQAMCWGYSWEVIKGEKQEPVKKVKTGTIQNVNKYFKLKDKFWFGKYAGKQIQWIIDNDLQYFNWSQSEKCNCKTNYHNEVLEYLKNKK